MESIFQRADVLECQERLKKLCTNTGFQVVQKNGQRICQLPTQETIFTPGKGCEVFVGKLPRDVMEDELVYLFKTVGPIYQIRLMIEFDGNSRGYCFISYYCSTDANTAVAKLNNYAIRPKKRIIVHKSLDNRRLFIGRIPNEKTEQDIFNVLNMCVSGVVKVILYTSWVDPKLNRGYAFVEFETHRHAALARRQLAPGMLSIWGSPFVADWAEPIPEISPTVLHKIKKLFIRNLDTSLSEDELIKAVLYYIPTCDVVKFYIKHDYGFIHFKNRKEAEYALIKLEGKTVGANVIDVSWARPVIYSKANRYCRPPTTWCLAVPPALRRRVLEYKKQEKSMFNINDMDPLSGLENEINKLAV